MTTKPVIFDLWSSPELQREEYCTGKLSGQDMLVVFAGNVFADVNTVRERLAKDVCFHAEVLFASRGACNWKIQSKNRFRFRSQSMEVFFFESNADVSKMKVQRARVDVWRKKFLLPIRFGVQNFISIRLLVVTKFGIFRLGKALINLYFWL